MNQVFPFSHFALGVCYYPEQWPEDLWSVYANQMRETGLTYARIGEFAWSRIQPAENEWNWDWLDRAMATLTDAGMSIVLGTPTGSPPPWLAARYPEMLPVDREGRRRNHGSRKHYDHASPVYRAFCRTLVTHMAERYGNHDAVIGWQIDNEWGESDSTRSWSECSLAAFRTWLEARYQSIDHLNDAWGGVFWSQEYRAWDEIQLPNLTMNDPNPSQVLDFYRFSSDTIVDFQNEQVEIIRRHSPGRFVTHNAMGNFDEVDYFRVADSLDFLSWDSYPLGQIDKGLLPGIDIAWWARTGQPDLVSFNHDLMRGIKAGAGPGPIVLEQQAGQINWAKANPLPADGAVQLWTMQAWAHGCDSVCYFRWRAAQTGQEAMHSGLLRHDGTLDRGGAEIVDLALPAAVLTPPVARVVLLHDFESVWIADQQRHSAEWSAWMQTMLFYSTLRRLGVDIDIRHPDAPIDGYDVIVAPCLQLMSDQRARHLADATRRSLLILGPRTGLRDEFGRVHGTGQPGPLHSLTGCRLLNFDGLWLGMVVEVGGEEASIWAESYAVDQGQALFAYDDGPLRGQAAVVRNGRAITIGALSSILIGRVLALALAEAGIEVIALDEGLRVSRRGDSTIWMNFNPEERHLPDGRPIGAAAYRIDDKPVSR